MFKQESIEKIYEVKKLAHGIHNYVSFNAKNTKACLKLFFSNIDSYSLCSELTTNGFWCTPTAEEDNQTCLNLNVCDHEDINKLYEILARYTTIKVRPVFH